MTDVGRVGDADRAGQASPGAAGASPPSGDHPSRMSDRALANALAPRDPDRMKLVAALTPAKREALEHLIWLAKELNAGRRPKGVICA